MPITKTFTNGAGSRQTYVAASNQNITIPENLGAGGNGAETTTGSPTVNAFGGGGGGGGGNSVVGDLNGGGGVFLSEGQQLFIHFDPSTGDTAITFNSQVVVRGGGGGDGLGRFGGNGGTAFVAPGFGTVQATYIGGRGGEGGSDKGFPLGGAGGGPAGNVGNGQDGESYTEGSNPSSAARGGLLGAHTPNYFAASKGGNGGCKSTASPSVPLKAGAGNGGWAEPGGPTISKIGCVRIVAYPVSPPPSVVYPYFDLTGGMQNLTGYIDNLGA